MFTLGGIASICFRFHFSKHCGCTPRGVRGVKRPEILWEIQKYSLPGRPSSQNWVKSKTICHFLRDFETFLNGLILISLNYGWMVDLAKSIFEYLTRFLVCWNPWHPWVCIHSDLKQLFETDMCDSSYYEHVSYTRFLSRLARKELNIPKLNSKSLHTVLIYILCKKGGRRSSSLEWKHYYDPWRPTKQLWQNWKTLI